MWEAIIKFFGTVLPFVKEAIIAFTAFYTTKLKLKNEQLEAQYESVKKDKAVEEASNAVSVDDKRKQLLSTARPDSNN